VCLLASAKTWARRIKRDVVAVDFAARHPDTPLRAPAGTRVGGLRAKRDRPDSRPRSDPRQLIVPLGLAPVLRLPLQAALQRRIP
jgi:hypothetical protein